MGTVLPHTACRGVTGGAQCSGFGWVVRGSPVGAEHSQPCGSGCLASAFLGLIRCGLALMRLHVVFVYAHWWCSCQVSRGGSSNTPSNIDKASRIKRMLCLLCCRFRQ